MSLKLLRPYQFLKIVLRVYNGPLFRHKSGLSAYSMFQQVGRVATRKLLPRNCLRFLQTTTILYGEGDGSQNICEVLSKNMNKKETGFFENLLFQAETHCFWCLGCDKWFYNKLINLALKKSWSVEIKRRFNEFLSLKLNILGIQAFFQFNTAMFLGTFLMEYIIEFVREVNDTHQII